MLKSRVLKWWTDLSVFKKLYGVVGVMALLIAFELFSMIFAMDVLSSVRSFVGGEGLWSKAQKDAIQSLYKYALEGDRRFYVEFQDHLRIPLGDRQARLELLKENANLAVVRDGFIKGQLHPDDIGGLIRLFQRFHSVSYIAKAIDIWTQADAMIDHLISAGAQLDIAVTSRDRAAVRTAVLRVDALNTQLTQVEIQFSSVLGEGSRWLEGLLRILLIFAVLIVESSSLFLTFTFARNLSRNIREMSRVAQRVGAGDFTQTVPVESGDELGCLAKDINKMTEDLQNSIGKKERAENANQLKSLFLANMSHEIRTPLGVILGLTEALKQPDVSPEDQQKFLRTIERTGNDLKQITNDILDISKVEAGHLTIEKSSFSLNQLLDDLRIEWDWKAKANGNTLVFQSEGKVPDMIYTDRIRVRQILGNLLGNALKFTRDGSVSLIYGYREPLLHFRFKDTGIGIPPDQEARLFQPFSQLDASTTRKYGGAGLGLFLSRRLAELLGGTIGLERNQMGTGSTFHVTIAADGPIVDLPPARPAEAVKHTESTVLRGKHVLIVDDSADNQLLLQFFLKKWGVTFESAFNGQEGVEKANQHPFDVVLMDIQMPILDGYQATRELRKSGFRKPIVALTAHAMKEDREKCLQAGCSDYLTKPVDFTNLHETLRRLLS